MSVLRDAPRHRASPRIPGGSDPRWAVPLPVRSVLGQPRVLHAFQTPRKVAPHVRHSRRVGLRASESTHTFTWVKPWVHRDFPG
eukprot:scaffold1440_cov332-Pavlova_lutheri.AAC.21